MTILFEERLSGSPYIETVTHGYTVCDGSSVRPAESRWHMVFVREHGRFHPLVVGPLTTAGVALYGEGAEILWIKFRLGVFMPHLPPRACLDVETALPGAARQSFWLKSAAWPFPDYEHVESFVDRLVGEEILVRDPVVQAMLQEQSPALSPRALRHRFLQATGLSQNHIGQVERAQRAAALLRQGRSILDTVEEAGYFDQPHLTRALKRWVGHTPAQIARQGGPA